MTVIAAVDRRKHATNVVAEAAELARAFEQDLQVIHVMSRAEFVDRQTESVEKSRHAIDLDRIRELAAEHAAEATDGLDMDHETVGLVGDPSEEICKRAEKLDAQYVVVGTRKRSPTGKAVFGSVPQSILLNAPCPVLGVNAT